eukprot:CAMPEP_0206032700 /NCGR_PEP_ID=MMETSP1466-20131121/127_1 /ASSEMBLY_ACC=CAM_ASM_001126 /TAXON_ID=44452 /ORGANISM="Pavlova gyrans, Strain CCMP608" /LENGTH=126 /DNA_ID=CAMNT_0053406837 /DNA_START=30 /DNA_END=410 /DNA_ORIENTATION=+
MRSSVLALAYFVVSMLSSQSQAQEASRFIITFPKSEVPAEDVWHHARELAENGGEIHRRYHTVLLGFAATVPQSYMPNVMSWPHVRLEADSVVRANEPSHQKGAASGSVGAGIVGIGGVEGQGRHH